MQAFASIVGRRPAIDMMFYNDADPFPWVDHAPLAGQIPLVTWQPGDLAIPATGILASINAGSYDAYLTARALACKARPTTVLFRPMHEMNGNWYPWSGFNNGGAGAGPAAYIAAWRRIVGLFQAAGATNVKFVWCPNFGSVPAIGTDPWNDLGAYYPGDAYVDVIAADGYNQGITTVTEFVDIFARFYSLFSGRGKPLMVGETSSADNGTSSDGVTSSNQHKGLWIVSMASVLATNFPLVTTFVWFNANKERDYRVDSSPDSLAAFQQVVANVRWLGL